MADTMTLDELKEAVADICAGCDTQRSLFTNAQLAAAIDAAIRERDELRDRLDSALGDRIREFRRANDESRRAEKAEAELAALRKRFAEPPTDAATLNRACDAYQESAETHGWDAEIVADVLRCDDMRAAIAAAWPVCTAGGE